ncbi:hypothetical protein [Mucilaginibacter sp. MD40]|nr:hypothetical protein [Mucilaginibacter sp. MD40]
MVTYYNANAKATPVVPVRYTMSHLFGVVLSVLWLYTVHAEVQSIYYRT